MLYASQVCFLWYSPPHHFSGIAKWLWSRCQQWKRLSRPWLTFTTTTWEATSTWESPSPSPPFKNLTHKLLTVPGFTVSELGAQKPFRLCLDTGGGGLNLFCCWSFVDCVIPQERLKLLTFFKENISVCCRYWILPAIICTSVFLWQAKCWHDGLSSCMRLWCRSVFNSWLVEKIHYLCALLDNINCFYSWTCSWITLLCFLRHIGVGYFWGLVRVQAVLSSSIHYYSFWSTATNQA